ncbi:hypothetical protein BDV98DRAFT_658860 [Pterulicium gracile]|uniref:Uncharacterized protein n=1 Tax=Pterulicium gracile TaxID=1884261 RepID=A0A5C3Q4I0_9AGAR|nr:hypothetical protein BDV98DRAFT_658860 [Pterula gracilis]
MHFLQLFTKLAVVSSALVSTASAVATTSFGDVASREVFFATLVRRQSSGYDLNPLSQFINTSYSYEAPSQDNGFIDVQVFGQQVIGLNQTVGGPLCYDINLGIGPISFDFKPCIDTAQGTMSVCAYDVVPIYGLMRWAV